MTNSLSPALARRVALAAQGFGRAPTRASTPASTRAASAAPARTPGIRQLDALVNRLQLLQVDSVNVFERSHYLPVFSRVGIYDKAVLDRLTAAKTGRYTEYWAHEASILPLDTWPLFRWRMQAYRDAAEADTSHWSHANRPMLDWLRAELAEKGPLPASAIEHDANKRSGPWWGWSDVKTGLEVLFRWGEVVSAGRSRFERVYALPEQVLPSELLGREIGRADAHRALISRAAQAHGVGTAKDFADYFRLKSAPARLAIQELEDAGELIPVTVPGWGTGVAAGGASGGTARGAAGAAWLHRDARLPRSIDAATILSPFDPVVWERARALRLFDFHYRIEIYTPKHLRVFGYYSLPVLLGDTIVGRVDLKNDRQAGVLRVQAAWAEPGAPADTAARLAAVLRDAATWQGLGEIVVAPTGTLSTALAAELR